MRKLKNILIIILFFIFLISGCQSKNIEIIGDRAESEESQNESELYQRMYGSKEEDDTSNYTTRLSTKEVSLPLYVRSRRNGDKISVKGMKGHKKVNDIFIESKISSHDRDIWPVVCDAKDNIIWIPGLKKSKFDRDKSEEYDIILKYNWRKEENLYEKKN